MTLASSHNSGWSVGLKLEYQEGKVRPINISSICISHGPGLSPQDLPRLIAHCRCHSTSTCGRPRMWRAGLVRKLGRFLFQGFSFLVETHDLTTPYHTRCVSSYPSPKPLKPPPATPLTTRPQPILSAAIFSPEATAYLWTPSTRQPLRYFELLLRKHIFLFNNKTLGYQKRNIQTKLSWFWKPS